MERIFKEYDVLNKFTNVFMKIKRDQKKLISISVKKPLILLFLIEAHFAVVFLILYQD